MCIIMINEKIKLRRILLGYSQKKMAELLFKSQSTYCRIESGELTLSPEDLKNVAAIFKCSLADLSAETAVVDILQQNREVSELMFRRLSNDQQELMETMMDIIRKSNEELHELIEERQEEQMNILLAEFAKLTERV
jgi:transcriptional regulator with XRE-family HTH domain